MRKVFVLGLFAAFLALSVAVSGASDPNHRYTLDVNFDDSEGSEDFTGTGDPVFSQIFMEGNGSVLLDGNDGASNAAFPTGATAQTYTGWINLTQVETTDTNCGQDPIFYQSGSGQGFIILAVIDNGGGGNLQLCLRVDDGSGVVKALGDIPDDIENTWQFVQATWADGESIVVFLNDTQLAITNLSGSGTQAADAYIGRDSGGSQGMYGHIDDFRVYNSYWNQTAATDLFNSYIEQPPEITELRFDVKDGYDTSTLTNATITVYNETDQLTNTTDAGGQIRIAGLVNLTSYTVNVSSNNSGGYFNFSTSLITNLTTTHQINMTQSLVFINASQLYTGQQINGVNVSFPLAANESPTTTNGVWIHLKAGSYVVNASATGHFNNSLNIAPTPLFEGSYTVNFSNAKSNLTLFNGLNNNTVTTGYTLLVNATNKTLQVDYTASDAVTTDIQLIQGYNFTFNIQSTENLADISKEFRITETYNNFSMFTQEIHSVNIEFLSELINQRFSTTPEANETVNLELVGPSTSNYTTNNGTLFITNLTPGLYEARYSATSFAKRSFFFNLPSGGGEDLELYLLNTSVDDLITLTIVDENDDPLNGSFVKVLKLFVSEDQRKIVQMGRADFNGQTGLNVVLNTQEYRFLVDSPFGTNVFATLEDNKVLSTSLTIRVTPASDRLFFITGYNQLSTNMNATNNNGNVTYTYTFADTKGFVADVCLRVDKLDVEQGNINLCETCATASAGTLTCNVNISSGTLSGYGVINTTNPHNLIDKAKEIIVLPEDVFDRNFGLFLSALVFIAVAASGVIHITLPIILGSFALVFTAWSGLLIVAPGALGGMIAAGFIILLKIRNR